MGYFSKLIGREETPEMDVVDSLLVKSDRMLLGLVEEMKSLVLQAEKVKLISELGFTNSEEFNKVKKVKNLLEEIEETYNILKSLADNNDDTFFIPFRVFKDILKEYNLFCGTFDKYKGDIPLENLRTIKRVKDRMNKVKSPYIPTRIEVCDKIDIFIHMYYSFQRSFTDEINQAFLNGRLSSIIMDFLRLPLSDHNLPQVYADIQRFVLETANAHDLDLGPHKTDAHLDINIDKKNIENLLICAPVDKMNPMVERIALDIKEIKPITKDPLIVSITRFSSGVIVHTGWGMEMNLDVVKRYQESTKRFLENAKPFMKGMKQIV